MTGALSVSPVTPALRPQVLALGVRPEQAVFSGQMPEVLEAAEADPHSEAMCIVYGGVVIGFYRLDFTPGAVAGRDFGVAVVGLRAYFLGVAHQGRGLGTAAIRAVVTDLRARHPDRRRLALSVNFRNPAALRTYEKAGFVSDPCPYLGGAAGPQHVMTLDL